MFTEKELQTALTEVKRGSFAPFLNLMPDRVMFIKAVKRFPAYRRELRHALLNHEPIHLQIIKTLPDFGAIEDEFRVHMRKVYAVIFASPALLKQLLTHSGTLYSQVKDYQFFLTGSKGEITAHQLAQKYADRLINMVASDRELFLHFFPIRDVTGKLDDQPANINSLIGLFELKFNIEKLKVLLWDAEVRFALPFYFKALTSDEALTAAQEIHHFLERILADKCFSLENRQAFLRLIKEALPLVYGEIKSYLEDKMQYVLEVWPDTTGLTSTTGSGLFKVEPESKPEDPLSHSSTPSPASDSSRA